MLRPSGVSSASEANCAASASCCSVTPGAGMNDDACRLPSVMVPVLSSNSTSTSPAASTARPEVAITLACIMRLMPATPMADNKPPMVVGIRHTSNAISTVMVIGVPALAASTLYSENGSKVTVTNRKMMVKATSKMVSAISFGVFLRLAPSTIAIMRSINASPGLTDDAHHQPVGQHARAAGDGGEIAARFADDRSRFAGDRAFVDRGDAFDDFAVDRDHIAGFDQDDIAFAQVGGRQVSVQRLPWRGVFQFLGR